jgi:hypothetical protein
MMKTLFVEKEISYDGSQLRPLYAYLEHKVLGDSIVSWVGPCDISFDNMKDGEDLIEESPIYGSQMLHFIVEIFHQSLLSGVSLQRLFASITRDYLQSEAKATLKTEPLIREGDDIYWKKRKLSISIASQSAVSVQIHFAMNISTEGTPVKTTSLQELKLKPRITAQALMGLWKKEFENIEIATKKVRPL